MASIFEHKDRNAIPNWRSFKRTVELGELNGLSSHFQDEVKLTLKEYINSWKTNKSISYAGDLISAAFVMQLHGKEVVEACNFLISKEKDCTPSLISLAKKILEKNEDADIPNNNKLKKIEDFINRNNFSGVYSKIRLLKKQIINFPYNPIQYVELGRLYSMLGQPGSSTDAIEMALRLAPNNRFVLRAATRLFYNLGDYDKAHFFLLKSNAIKVDPWLMSSEIAIATVLSKYSKLINKGKTLLSSNNISPFEFTELACSIGTVEARNGSNKLSKKLFEKALISPNDNSLAQTEWASNQFNLFKIELNKFKNLQDIYEVKTWDALFNNEWEETVENSIDWFLDMPNNKDPLIIGARVASICLDDHFKASTMMKAALTSFPHDNQVLNNTAYFLALDNKAVEANKFITEASKNLDVDSPVNTSDLCLIATLGLVNFRLENYDKGRMLYLHAINCAKKIDKNYYLPLAILNYAREELNIGSNIPSEFMTIIEKIDSSNLDFEVIKLKEKILKVHSENSNSVMPRN